MTKHYGVECWLNEKRFFVLQLDSVDPDRAQEIAWEVFKLQRGGEMEASEVVTVVVKLSCGKGVSPSFPLR